MIRVRNGWRGEKQTLIIGVASYSDGSMKGKYDIEWEWHLLIFAIKHFSFIPYFVA